MISHVTLHEKKKQNEKKVVQINTMTQNTRNN